MYVYIIIWYFYVQVRITFISVYMCILFELFCALSRRVGALRQIYVTIIFLQDSDRFWLITNPRLQHFLPSAKPWEKCVQSV